MIGSIYCCTTVSLTAFGNFLPVLVKHFGFSTITTNLLTVPVWFFTALCIVCVGYLSDHLKQRGWLLMLCFGVASTGYIVLLARPPPWVEYAFTFFMGAGTYPTVVLVQTWYASNMIGFTKRYYFPLQMHLQSNTNSDQRNDHSPFLHARPMPLRRQLLRIQRPALLPPRQRLRTSIHGHGVCVSGILIKLLMRRNRKKVLEQDSPEAVEKRALGAEDIQDGHPDFMYYL